jgi:hypothetical protein
MSDNISTPETKIPASLGLFVADQLSNVGEISEEALHAHLVFSGLEPKWADLAIKDWTAYRLNIILEDEPNDGWQPYKRYVTGYDPKKGTGRRNFILKLTPLPEETPKEAPSIDERPIPNTLEIHAYIHCGMCLTELPPDQSPREYASYEVGWTKLGFQVWCKRHEVNVMHVDFQGQKHPANTTREAPEEQ